MEEKGYVSRKVAIFGIVCVGVTGMLAGLLTGYGVNGGYGVNWESNTERSNTNVETVTDKIPVRKPVAKDSTVISYIKVPIAGMKGGTQNDQQEAAAMQPHTQHADDKEIDSAAIYLPRTQKRYEDSTYTAWVSGYEPRLDSIDVYRKTTTITKTITRTVTKRHVFNVGIVGGAGYGLLTKKPDVWVGVGVSINLFRR